MIKQAVATLLVIGKFKNKKSNYSKVVISIEMCLSGFYITNFYIKKFKGLEVRFSVSSWVIL
jgi:hypothetical protein